MNRLKKGAWISLLAILSTSLVSPIAFSDSPFTDIAEDDEYYTAIYYVYENGVVEGYEDGSYKPNQTVNRAEFTKMVVNALYDSDQIYACDQADHTLSDLDQEEWYAKSICIALRDNLLDGYDDGSFQPANTINFAEAAKITANAFALELGGRADQWYEPYVVALDRESAIPLEIDAFDTELTRGQFAEIIYRLDAGVTDRSTQTYGSLDGVADPMIVDGESYTHGYGESDHSGPGGESGPGGSSDGGNSAPGGTTYEDGDSETIASLSIPSSNYLGDYTIEDTDSGTEMTVTVSSTTRSISANALPNHETGEFPNSGNPNTISEQSNTYSYPVEGTYSGEAVWSHTPGVAINGVKFEPETAETVTCDSGESYKIEALQETYNLGFDFNNAHVQPTGDYHYHGYSSLLSELYDEGEDLIHIGFAADGHMIYYDTTGTVVPSYEVSSESRSGTGCDYRSNEIEIEGTTPDGTYVSDWVYNSELGNLDACNGAFIEDEYAYFITDEYPFIGRCLQGE